MLVKRTEFKDSDNSIGYVECVFVSDNILKTIYFYKTKKMYVSFSRGGTYSYINVTKEKYLEFENSESQGVFFQKHFAKNKDYQSSKEFTLMQDEISEIKNIILENTNNI
jgi:hypothetical protein